MSDASSSPESDLNHYFKMVTDPFLDAIERERAGDPEHADDIIRELMHRNPRFVTRAIARSEASEHSDAFMDGFHYGIDPLVVLTRREQLDHFVKQWLLGDIQHPPHDTHTEAA